MNGATQVSGLFGGQAFSFNDGSSEVEAPATNLPTGNADRTMAMWVNVTSYNPGNESFFAGYGNFGTFNSTYQLGINSNHALFFSQWGAQITGPVLSLGTWYYVAVTNVGDTATLYLNGTQVASGTFGVGSLSGSSINTAAGTTFDIGTITNPTYGAGRNLVGMVQGIQVYGGALSPAQIQTLYNFTPPTLTDTADVEGGYYETGNLVFTLSGPNGFSYSQTDVLNGNGTYTASDTLATTGTVAGTYTWSVSYVGDANNNSAEDQGGTAEQTVVSAASPTLSTSPNPTNITLSNITPPTLTDTATLAAGYYETGDITFTLYYGNSLVDTETVSVSGNGSYTTPTGYTLPTTGTVTGTYQWDASYGPDGNNNSVSDNNNANEQVAVGLASPTLVTTASAAVTLGTTAPTISDSAVLAGGYNETGSVSFTLKLGSTTVYTTSDTVSGDGTYSASYTLPTTGTVTGTYAWTDSYSGDTNNNSASGNTDSSEQTVVSAASPTLSTSPSATSITLGNSGSPVLKDTATLAAGYYETGDITFTLYYGNSLVDTETVSVSGNGSYTTPTGYTLPTTGTVTGTYQWDASYGPDGNNNSVSDNNNANEQVAVGLASPTLVTTASAAVTLGTTAPTISDSAVLAGGYNETGSVSFTLKLGSTTVYTTSDTVSGDGTYSASYTLPTTGTVTGTYAWTDSYSGDTNNNSASGNTDSSEQTVVSAASPTLSTSPSATSITLGNSGSPVLKDTATLAAGYYETGDITFTLYYGNSLVDTETVSVSGNGSYTTPTGYTLPTTGTVTGTYQWDASYGPDGNNNSVSDNNNANEQVAVGLASPTLVTTASAAVTLGTTAPTISDSAVLAGGYNETGSVSFTLKLGSTTVYTTSDTVSGDGTYSASYTLPTTGTVTGTYAWTDSYSGDTNNNSASGNADSSEQTVVSAASPTLSTSPSATSITLGNSGSPVLKDTATLAAGYYETGDITFTLYYGNSLVDTETVSVSGNGSYTTPTGYTLPTTGTVTGTYQWDASYGPDGNNNSVSDNNNANEQVAVGLASPTLVTTASAAVTLGTTAPTISDSAVLAGGYNETGSVSFTLKLGSTTVYTTSDTVSGDGTYSASYTLPTTGTVTGTYAWTDSYSGDTNNNSASGNTDSSEQTVVSAASPTLSTSPSATSITLGNSGSPVLKDTATLAAGYYETGDITFTLYYGNSLVDTETVSVSGNGSYTTPTGYTLPTTGTVTGTYQWDASYGPDGNNNSVSDNNNANEQVAVGLASPTLVTTASAAVTLGTTAPTISDSAVLAGGYNETGSVSFTLKLGSTTVYTTSDTVSGDGTYSASYTLPTTGTVTGTYAWTDSYSGDTNNNSASGNTDSSEQTVVSAASPTLSTSPSRDEHHARQLRLAGPEGHGHPGGRLLRDGRHHLYAVLRQQLGGHGDGVGERQRQLHDAHGVHPAHHGHGHRDLPVGCQLRPRRQQ